jgi:hypothetical protein
MQLLELYRSLASPSSGTARKRWLIVIKVLFSAGLIWYVVNRIGTGNVLPILLAGDRSLLLLAALLVFANFFFQFLKWKVLANTLLGERNNIKILFSLLQGIAAGAFTPVRIGEYIGRKFVFEKQGLLEITVATFIDKLLMLFIIIFSGVFGAILFLRFRMMIPVYLSGALFTVLAVSFIVFAYILLNKHTWQTIAELTVLKMKFLQPFIERIKILKQLDNKTLALSITLNAAAYMVFLTQYALLLQAFDHSASLSDAYWCGILMFFTKTAIPAVSFGDVGIRELASVFFAGQLHLSEAAGLNAAFAIFIINIALPALIGMVLFYVKVTDD